MSDELTIAQTENGHARIDALEQALLSVPDALVDMPLVHRFTPGIYSRELSCAAGVIATTKIHKVEHQFVLLRGSISTWTPDDGGTVQHLTAPCIGITKAGTRRVIVTHDDTVFITFHPNADNTEDLEALESRLVESRTGTYEAYKAILDARTLSAAGGKQ